MVLWDGDPCRGQGLDRCEDLRACLIKDPHTGPPIDGAAGVEEKPRAAFPPAGRNTQEHGLHTHAGIRHRAPSTEVMRMLEPLATAILFCLYGRRPT